MDDLQIATPDRITKEVINSVDHGEDDFSGEGGMKVCAECLEELKEIENEAQAATKIYTDSSLKENPWGDSMTALSAISY